MTKFLNSLNKHSKNKLLVILGPTASGKSDLAIKLAKMFDGEIVSADSRQIYKGMDIGTGKVKIESINNDLYSEGARHHLLDVADPKEYFSVSQYQKLAVQAIKDIQKRGKLPILCGGTGLYLSAVTEGWQLSDVPPDNALRQKLERLSNEGLLLKLRALDPKRAKTIDKSNRRRLIRAIEIATLKGYVPSLKKTPPAWDILILGIKKDKKELRELILARLEKRLKEGMIDEVRSLKDNGVSSGRLEDFGLEYRWVNRYLEKKIPLPEMKKKIHQHSCQYAKRQMTWFKKIPDVRWIDNDNEAAQSVSDFVLN